MDYESFLDALGQRTALDRQQADTVTKTTLHELGQQVSPHEMRELLAGLPDQLTEDVTPAPPDQQRHMPLDEFCERVAGSAGVDDPDTARAHVHSVFAVLGRAVDADQLRAAVAQLRPEYQALLPADTDTAQEFLSRVRERLGLTDEAAVHSTHATLRALSDRISEGQASELAGVLPTELRPYLDTAKGSAQPFDQPGFLGRVGAEAGLADHDDAQAHARAVLSTVNEWAPQGKLDDTLAQLPPELAQLFS